MLMSSTSILRALAGFAGALAGMIFSIRSRSLAFGARGSRGGGDVCASSRVHAARQVETNAVPGFMRTPQEHRCAMGCAWNGKPSDWPRRSEEHTSELQSP